MSIGSGSVSWLLVNRLVIAATIIGGWSFKTSSNVANNTRPLPTPLILNIAVPCSPMTVVCVVRLGNLGSPFKLMHLNPRICKAGSDNIFLLFGS